MSFLAEKIKKNGNEGQCHIGLHMFKNKCNWFQWDFENDWSLIILLHCSLLIQVLINSIDSIICLLQQLAKNLGQILAIIVLNLFREKLRAEGLIKLACALC